MNGKKPRTVQYALASVLGGIMAGAGVLMSADAANAQAAYGSYVGIGVGVGVTSDGDGDGGGLAGVIAGRYRFLRVPLSIRAQAFIGDGFAIVPTVSYDYPISWNTDVYLGAGVSFTSDDETSVLGDQTAFVLQPGIDYMFPNSRLAAFGNAVIAFDAFRDGGTAVSVQGGVGYQF